jgi:hypothetical protein
MSALGAKLRRMQGGLVAFWCPGCDGAHQVGVGDGPGPRWGFNGDGDKPTFTPSILVRGVQRMTDDEYARIMGGEHIEPRPFVCHSFVTDGRIRFLGDCTHSLAGQTVDLPDFETG